MTSDEVARLHFVVRRFEELKGLRFVVTGAAWTLVFGAGSALDVSRHLGEWGLTVMILICTVPLLAGAWLVDRYYATRFGRVRGSQPAPAWLRTTSAVALMLVGMRAGLGMVPYLVGLGAACMWVTVRDWPFRRHWVLGTGATWLAAGISMASGAPGSDQVVMSGFATVGGWLIGVGLLDHRLLSKALPGLYRGDPTLARERR